MVKNIKELRLEIDKIMPDDYCYNIDFCEDYFEIEVDNWLLIRSNPIEANQRVVYEFVLDIEDADYITYEELKLSKNIIDILNKNKDFITSKLKKYTVEELEEERRKDNLFDDVLYSLLDAFKGLK